MTTANIIHFPCTVFWFLLFTFFFSKLEKLFLCDLPAVKDMEKVLGILRGELLNCEIRYLSLEGLKDLKALGKDKDFDG